MEFLIIIGVVLLLVVACLLIYFGYTDNYFEGPTVGIFMHGLIIAGAALIATGLRQKLWIWLLAALALSFIFPFIGRRLEKKVRSNSIEKKLTAEETRRAKQLAKRDL